MLPKLILQHKLILRSAKCFSKYTMHSNIVPNSRYNHSRHLKWKQPIPFSILHYYNTKIMTVFKYNSDLIVQQCILLCCIYVGLQYQCYQLKSFEKTAIHWISKTIELELSNKVHFWLRVCKVENTGLYLWVCTHYVSQYRLTFRWGTPKCP